MKRELSNLKTDYLKDRNIFNIEKAKLKKYQNLQNIGISYILKMIA